MAPCLFKIWSVLFCDAICSGVCRSLRTSTVPLRWLSTGGVAHVRLCTRAALFCPVSSPVPQEEEIRKTERVKHHVDDETKHKSRWSSTCVPRYWADRKQNASEDHYLLVVRPALLCTRIGQRYTCMFRYDWGERGLIQYRHRSACE